jgi:hypothetical protein
MSPSFFIVVFFGSLLTMFAALMFHGARRTFVITPRQPKQGWSLETIIANLNIAAVQGGFSLISLVLLWCFFWLPLINS